MDKLIVPRYRNYFTKTQEIKDDEQISYIHNDNENNIDIPLSFAYSNENDKTFCSIKPRGTNDDLEIHDMKKLMEENNVSGRAPLMNKYLGYHLLKSVTIFFGEFNVTPIVYFDEIKMIVDKYKNINQCNEEIYQYCTTHDITGRKYAIYEYLLTLNTLVAYEFYNEYIRWITNEELKTELFRYVNIDKPNLVKLVLRRCKHYNCVFDGNDIVGFSRLPFVLKKIIIQ
jgi:hypothetical protein